MRFLSQSQNSTILPASSPWRLTRDFDSDTLQGNLLAMYVLHVVVQAGVVGDLAIVAQSHILLLPVPVHHLVGLLEEVALPQGDAPPTTHLMSKVVSVNLQGFH